MRNFIFPDDRALTIDASKGRLVMLQKIFCGTLVLTKQKYEQELINYVVNKSDFVSFVSKQVSEFKQELALKVKVEFQKMDSLHQRDGINNHQFFNLIE